MKAYLYILKSDSDRYYVGSTSDIARRLKQHNYGHTHTTKRMHHIKLVFKQAYNSLKVARTIEKRIKSWKRKDFIEKIIKDGYIKLTGCGSVG